MVFDIISMGLGLIDKLVPDKVEAEKLKLETFGWCDLRSEELA